MQGIYQILYKGKCAYVGSSLDINRRFSQHKISLSKKVHRNFILQRMWNKNPQEFVFCILEEVMDKKLLIDREQYYIDTLKPCTNLSKANGSHPHTEETKKKMKGRVISEKTRKLMSELKKGKPNGRKGIPTHRIPRSAFKKGLIPWNKGKPRSKQDKQKMSDAAKKNWSNPIYRKIMSDSHKKEKNNGTR